MGDRVYVLSGSPRVLIGQQSVLKPCGWTALSDKSIAMDTTVNIDYADRKCLIKNMIGSASRFPSKNILSPWPHPIHSKLHSSNKQKNVVRCALYSM